MGCVNPRRSVGPDSGCSAASSWPNTEPRSRCQVAAAGSSPSAAAPPPPPTCRNAASAASRFTDTNGRSSGKSYTSSVRLGSVVVRSSTLVTTARLVCRKMTPRKPATAVSRAGVRACAADRRASTRSTALGRLASSGAASAPWPVKSSSGRTARSASFHHRNTPNRATATVAVSACRAPVAPTTASRAACGSAATAASNAGPEPGVTVGLARMGGRKRVATSAGVTFHGLPPPASHAPFTASTTAASASSDHPSAASRGGLVMTSHNTPASANRAARSQGCGCTSAAAVATPPSAGGASSAAAPDAPPMLPAASACAS